MPLGTCLPRSSSVPAGLGYGYSASGRNSASGLWEVGDSTVEYKKAVSGSVPKLPRLPASKLAQPPSKAPAAGKRKHEPGGAATSPKPKPESKETAQLLLDISVMKYAELGRIGDRVWARKAKDRDEGEKLGEAFVTRVAELLYGLKCGELGLAKALLDSTQGLPVAESPARTLEQRLCVLAQAAANLEDLMCCRATALQLKKSGQLGPKAYDAAMSCLDRWVAKAPMREMRRLVKDLAAVTMAEKVLLRALEQRLAKQAVIGLNGNGQLRGFVQLLLEFKEGGVRVLEGARKPVLDEPSGELLPLVLVAMLGAVRDSLKIWSMEKLMVEFSGPVLRLPAACPKLRGQFLAAVAQRALRGLDAVSQMVDRRADPLRVQQELLIWAKFVAQVGRAGLLEFDAATRQQLLGGPLEPTSMAFCLAVITPGAREFPPEYLPRAAPLRARQAEVQEAMEEAEALVACERAGEEPPPGCARSAEASEEASGDVDEEPAGCRVTFTTEQDGALDLCS